MSDYRSGCEFHPRRRTGDDACPLTTLDWNFLQRHRTRLERNARMAREHDTLDRLDDVSEVTERARQVKEAIEEGCL